MHCLLGSPHEIPQSALQRPHRPGITPRTMGVHMKNRGQATTEYALVLLVAAVIATLVIAWATAGGGAGKIGGLFDSIFSSILDRASASAIE